MWVKSTCTYTYMHTYIHIYIRITTVGRAVCEWSLPAHIHTCMHTYIHIYIRITTVGRAVCEAYLHMYIHTHIHTYIHTSTQLDVLYVKLTCTKPIQRSYLLWTQPGIALPAYRGCPVRVNHFPSNCPKRVMVSYFVCMCVCVSVSVSVSVCANSTASIPGLPTTWIPKKEHRKWALLASAALFMPNIHTYIHTYMHTYTTQEYPRKSIANGSC